MRRWLVGGLATIAVVAVLALPFVHESGDFRAWLAEARGGDDDRGWDRLHPTVRDAFRDRGAYLADVDAVDWDRFVLAEPVDLWVDDGFAHIEARLLSDPGSVPWFLFEKGIVHAVCDEAWRPIGVGVFEDRRPFAGSRFSGGGVTGSQRRCQEAFRAAASGGAERGGTSAGDP